MAMTPEPLQIWVIVPVTRSSNADGGLPEATGYQDSFSYRLNINRKRILRGRGRGRPGVFELQCGC